MSTDRIICSLKNPKWLWRTTTVRVSSRQCNIARCIMDAGLWWASSLVLCRMPSLVNCSSVSSDDRHFVHGNHGCLPSSARILSPTTRWNLLMPDLTELLTYYVIVAVVFIGAPGVFFFIVFMPALQNTKGRMVGYKDHKTYGDSTIYEVNRTTWYA